MKKYFPFLLIFPIIPLFLFISISTYGRDNYSLLSGITLVLAFIPFIITVEKNKVGLVRCALTALATLLSVLGRLAFSFTSNFKPVSAIATLTGVYLGPTAGFLTGVLTAFTSNFYFGQGPWTPFQMFAWGFVGYLSGMATKGLKGSLLNTSIFGFLTGVLFSLLMDAYNVIWINGAFTFSKYIVAVTSSAPFTLTYGISNVIFILILQKPLEKLIVHILKKKNSGEEEPVEQD